LPKPEMTNMLPAKEFRVAHDYFMLQYCVK